MCYSFRVSILTGMTSWIIGVYILCTTKSTKVKKDMISLLIFSSMQFADAILWYIDMKKNKINLFTTRFLIPLLLSMQLLYANYFYFEKVHNIKLVFVWLYVFYLFFIKFDNYSIKSPKCKQQNCSPVWGGSDMTLIEMVIFFFLTYFTGFNTSSMTIIPVILFIYWYFDFGYGSHWCAISNLIAFKYLLINT